MRHGGLCEGYGGTTMAAAAVLGPLDTRWVAETKPAARRLIEQRYPGVENVGDLTAAWPVDGPLPFLVDDIEPVDVVTVSWPCQPHSPAGKQLGMADPRAIWPNCARSIAATRPMIVLGENVPRVVRNGELDRVIASLRALGYVVVWRLARADHLGFCHRRERLFFVAVRADALDLVAEHVGEQPWWGAQVLADLDRLTLLPTPGRRDGKGVMPRAARNDGYARSIAQLDLPGAVALMAGELPDVLASTDLALLPTPTTRNGKGPDQRGARRDGGGCAPDLQTVAINLTGIYAPALARHAAALGRPAPSPTIPRATGTGTPQLSPMFVEWMMCLPPGWVTDLADLGQARAAGWRPNALSLLGDGVIPEQGAYAYRDLLYRMFNGGVTVGA